MFLSTSRVITSNTSSASTSPGPATTACAASSGRAQRTPRAGGTSAAPRPRGGHGSTGSRQPSSAGVPRWCANRPTAAGSDRGAAADLGWIEGTTTCRGQLDGERDAVETAADPGDGACAGGVEEQRRLCPQRPVDEEPGRRGPVEGSAVQFIERGGTASDRRRHITSPETPSGSRLVASTVTEGFAARTSVTSSAQSSARCSQLSSASSDC